MFTFIIFCFIYQTNVWETFLLVKTIYFLLKALNAEGSFTRDCSFSVYLLNLDWTHSWDLYKHLPTR